MRESVVYVSYFACVNGTDDAITAGGRRCGISEGEK